LAKRRPVVSESGSIIGFSKSPFTNIPDAMRRKQPAAGLLAILLIGSGCAKRSEPQSEPKTVALVPASEMSRHFEAVNRHLDLGGTLYLFADVDGDASKLASTVQSLTEGIANAQPMAAPYLKQDYNRIFADLGLSDIKAIGLSSVPSATGDFRNNVFFYTPEGRHGLLAAMGGQPGPVRFAKLAPFDTDWFAEGELNLPEVYTTVRTIVRRVAGESMVNVMDGKLKEAGGGAGMSVLEVINSFRARYAIILRVDPNRNVTVSGSPSFTVPAFSFLVRIDGIGAALEGAVGKIPDMERSQEGSMRIFSLKTPLPVQDLHPTAAIDGGVLYIATSREFLLECSKRQSGLDQHPDFKAALAQLGTESNGVGYVSPRLFKRLSQLEQLNPKLPPEGKRLLNGFVGRLPAVDHPLTTVRINLPDGILFRSRSYHSLKQDLALLTVFNPVTLGVMTAMAIPAFEKVREASQEKVVFNNLQMLESAADRYYLEHGTDSAKLDDLVGQGKYITALKPVAGEDYGTVKFRKGAPLFIRLGNGHWVTTPRRNNGPATSPPRPVY
jgi:type IV pilus assembly protein PilA